MSDVSLHHRLFAELRRRHVLRVAAIYGAAGFAILLVLELLGGSLRLPILLVRLGEMRLHLQLDQVDIDVTRNLHSILQLRIHLLLSDRDGFPSAAL